MAKKIGLAQIERYNAMRRLVEGKQKRTLGELFSLRRTILDDISAEADRRDVLLDRVYGGQKAPPDTGRWNPHPHHRFLFMHETGKRNGLKVYDFGWTFHEPYRENRRRGWVVSWSEDFYDGPEDARLIRAVNRRDPKNEIDELVCAGVVAEVMAQNDEPLTVEFDRVQHRLRHLFMRKAVVSNNISVSVTAVLERDHDWRAGREEPWRRVTFDDGTVITVTSTGEMIFDDVIVSSPLSLLEPAKVHEAWPNNLAERQRRALERK